MRRLLLETYVRNAVILSYIEDSCYETYIEGGRLDGWKLSAETEMEVVRNHYGIQELLGGPRACDKARDRGKVALIG